MNFVLKLSVSDPAKLSSTGVYAAVNKTIAVVDPHAAFTDYTMTYDAATSTANVTLRVREDLARTKYATAKALKDATAGMVKAAVKSGKLTTDLDEECDCDATVEEVERDYLNRNYPTLLPTLLPTSSPTSSPSTAPTFVPTVGPTPFPSVVPTSVS